MSQHTRRWNSLLVVVLASFTVVLSTLMVRQVDANSSEIRQSNIVYLPFVSTPASVLEVPTLLYPENGAVLGTLIPTFKWDLGATVPGVLRYSCLAYDRNPNYLSGCSVSGGGDSGIQEWLVSQNLERATLYYWRVGFILDLNYDDIRWSDVRTFTSADAGGPIPDSPELASPADDSTISPAEAVLRWEAVNGVEEYQVTAYPAGGGGGRGWTLEDTEVDASGYVKPGQSYEWYVSARNDYAWSDDSQTWEFNVSPSATILRNRERSSSESIIRIIDNEVWSVQTD